MIENRMVVGNYDPDPMLIDEASMEDMACFVGDDDQRVTDVISALDPIDIWEHLPDDYIERISARYARKHPYDYADWRLAHGKV